MIVVEIQNLQFSYNKRTPVLQGINLKIQENERVGFIGPNGAGKTTLLLLIAGLLKGKGKIRLWGMEQPEHFKKLRKRIGFLFQDPDNQLFYPWVYEEVAERLQVDGKVYKPTEGDVFQILSDVGLLDKARWPVSELSPGEKKRLALATLLTQKPDLWLFDEPSSGLDPMMRRTLIDWIKNLHGTIVVATHDLDLVLEICQRVFLLFQGKIVAEGQTSEILSDEHLLETYGLTLPLTLQGAKHE